MRAPRLLSVDPRNPDGVSIERAAAVLRAGGLVAFPTETVYGLGGLATDERAVRRIYEAKGRPAHNPLIAHVADAAAARALGRQWPDAAERLAAAFWPGPLTLVVERSPAAPATISAGLDSIAVRVPAHPIARALLAAVGEPVAAPSANPSGRISPTRAEHVVSGLGERVDLVLDGGPCDEGLESAVIDVRGERPRLLRPGTLTFDALRRVVPDLEPPPADPLASAARASPGLEARHYAPRTPLELHEHAALAARARELADAGRSSARLVRAPLDAPGEERVLGPDPTAWSQALYETLHDLDGGGHAFLLAQTPPDDCRWWAVSDRLRRAAARS